MILAVRSHYAEHLDPVKAVVRIPDDVALVASHRDLVQARARAPRRVILAQHGAGQSYGGDPGSAHIAAYPGGADNDDVGLFLVPNHHAADRWRQAYPRAAVRVVGCPKLATLPGRGAGVGPCVAFATHWNARTPPEAGSALRWFLPAIAALAERYYVIGHGHPRRDDLERVCGRMGIEYFTDFADVCRRADVLIADNTSVLYEFASTGRPVVVLNAPTYRRHVRHGLRFWDAIPGPQVDRPEELADQVERALAGDRDDVSARNAAVDTVYAVPAHQAASTAAQAIADWLS